MQYGLNGHLIWYNVQLLIITQVAICPVTLATYWWPAEVPIKWASEWGRKEKVARLLVPEGVSHKLLICWNFHSITTISRVYREWSDIQRKYPASRSSVEEKDVLKWGVSGDWADWLESGDHREATVTPATTNSVTTQDCTTTQGTASATVRQWAFWKSEYFELFGCWGPYVVSMWLVAAAECINKQLSVGQVSPSLDNHGWLSGCVSANDLSTAEIAMMSS